MSIEDERAKRWGYARGKIKTLPRAAAFIEDLGFALLFSAKKIDLPALWVAATDVEPGADIIEGWGPDAERVWGWKDALPLRGLAWYGPFLRGRKGFLAPGLLRDLYPRRARPEDFRQEPLSEDARKIAEVILVSGPTSLAVLREAIHRSGPTFDAAVKELGRSLVVTHYGVEEQGAGWPSAVLELTSRAFDVHSRAKAESRRVSAAGRFLSTMIEAKAVDLARTFGWTTQQARAALDELAMETNGVYGVTSASQRGRRIGSAAPRSSSSRTNRPAAKRSARTTRPR